MSTTNFAYKNASHVYEVSNLEDEFDLELLADRADEDFLSNLGFESDAERGSEYCSRGSYKLMERNSYKEFVNEDTNESETVSFNLSIYVRFGYYESACLDYELNIEDESYNEFQLEDGNSGNIPESLANSLCENLFDEVSDEAQKLKYNEFKKVLEEHISKEIETAEKALKWLCGAEYRCLGVASNGEGFYEKIEAEK